MDVTRTPLSMTPATAATGITPRAARATRAEAYYAGTQYDHLLPWARTGVPLRAKKPCIIVPLYAECIDRLDAFVWGAGQPFPPAMLTATRDPHVPADPREVGPALLPDQAATLTTFLAALATAGGLRRTAREAARRALVTTSVATILGFQGGHLVAHVESGKHCTPIWDPTHPRRLAALEIAYVHAVADATASGFVAPRRMWYRRVLDATADTVYRAVPFVPGVPPVWTVDEAASVTHDLGFCPAVWARTLPDGDPLDGRPVIAPQLYGMLDAVNYAISQRDRAVAFGADPQLVRQGVAAKDRAALIKNPGAVWDVDATAAIAYLETTGAGAATATAHLTDLALRFRQATRIVALDPEKFSGAVSGRFLELLYAEMIALAGDLREDLGDHAYGDLLGLALRLVMTAIGRGETIYIPGAHGAADVLRAAQPAGVWLDLPITLAWGPWFAPSPEEQGATIANAVAAKTGQLITAATASAAVAPLFHVADPAVEAATAAREAMPPTAPAAATPLRPAASA